MEETDARQKQILTGHPLDRLPPALMGGVVAIGNFDGVHRGHAALLARAMEDARARSAKAVVLTFEPNPRTFFRPADPVFRLTPPAAQARLLTAIGLDGLVVASFDEALAALSPEDFVSAVLVERLRVGGVIVGEDFRFGRRRAGTAATLLEAGRRFGFSVDVVPAVVAEDGLRISSSDIRSALAGGDVEAANRLLGYRWFTVGVVISGDRRGRALGFPTANICLPADCRLRHGIYAVTYRRPGGATFPGVASYGRRPQFGNGPPVLEVFIFDFAGDLYGEQAIVTFHGWIRPERVFPSVAALVGAMQADAEEARALVARAGPGSKLDQALAALG
jgi:riboflavin kinase/FMN adenylyltransferase